MARGGPTLTQLSVSVLIALVQLGGAAAFIANQAPLRIDCGSGIVTTNTETNQTFLGDAYFSGGVPHAISSLYSAFFAAQPDLLNLRAFPDSNLSCYTLPVASGRYLIRINVLYGNYDSLESPPSFQILVNDVVVDLIESLRSNSTYTSDYLTYAPELSVKLCVVPITGTPILSSIELYPIDTESYDAEQLGPNVTLRNIMRMNVGGPSISGSPEDIANRQWQSDARHVKDVNFSTIRYSGAISGTGINGPPDNLPEKMFQSALTNGTLYRWNILPVNNPSDWYVRWHFAELDGNVIKGERLFYVIVSVGDIVYVVANDFDILSYAGVAYNATTVSTAFRLEDPNVKNFVNIGIGIVKNASSKYEPILNGMEMYEAFGLKLVPISIDRKPSHHIWLPIVLTICGVLLVVFIALLIVCLRRRAQNKPFIGEGGFFSRRSQPYVEETGALRHNPYQHSSNGQFDDFRNVELSGR